MAVERRAGMEQVDAIIRQLRDVISARVVYAPDGSVDEVHVLCEPSRAPKQVVRDVESALYAHLGIRIDHKKVSVAQVQGGAAPKPAGNRLKIADVSVSLNSSSAEATVRLTRDGDVFSGTANGHGSSSGQLKLIATATLKAVEESGAAEGPLVLEDVQSGISLAGQSAVCVCTNLSTSRGDDLLVGCALVKKDIWKAAVNATLDAVNRRLSTSSSEE